MAFTSIHLKEAWNWGGLSFRELMVRTYRAMDKHDTLNQAAVVAFYGMKSLVPLLGLVLSLALGARTGVAALGLHAPPPRRRRPKKSPKTSRRPYKCPGVV